MKQVMTSLFLLFNWEFSKNLSSDLTGVTVPETALPVLLFQKTAQTPVPAKSSSKDDNVTEQADNQGQTLIRSEVKESAVLELKKNKKKGNYSA